MNKKTYFPFAPELLVPAGNREKLDVALLYGADAVYLGGTTMNLRAGCEGFTHAGLLDAVQVAHAACVQVFFCLNSLPKESDIQAIPPIIEQAAEAKVDAFIIADPGIFRMARRLAPSIPIHVSTQANTANSEAIAFWHDLGATRVNLAREMTAKDILAIRKSQPVMELEVFIHGAMCLAISGKCLMSAWLNNRSANMGRCTHPCRFQYGRLDKGSGCCENENDQPLFSVDEATRPGEPLWDIRAGGMESPLEEYSSIWAPEDLCLMPYIPWFFHNKITAVKIEGRMKGAGYTAQVTDAYATAIDVVKKGLSVFNFTNYMPDLFHTASRPLGTGFFIPGKRRNFTKELAFSMDTSSGHHNLIGKLATVLGDGSSWEVDVRGQWLTKAPVQIMLPGMRRPVVVPDAVEKLSGERVSMAHSGSRVVVRFNAQDADLLANELRSGVILRGVQA